MGIWSHLLPLCHSHTHTYTHTHTHNSLLCSSTPFLGWSKAIPSIKAWFTSLRTEQDSMRFHHTIQNSMQFKTYELFISGIFYIIFFGPWLTVGDWNCGKQNLRWRGTTVPQQNHVSVNLAFWVFTSWRPVTEANSNSFTSNNNLLSWRWKD